MGFSSTPTQSVVINGFGTSVSSNAMTATATGSLIVVGVTNQVTSGNAVSVTDNIGNTYLMALQSPGVSQRNLEYWYCLSATAGVTSVTVNNGATSTNVVGYVQEWAGGASALRAQNSLNNASGTTTPATVTPAVGDVVIGNLGYQAAVASTTQDTGTDGTYTYLTTLIRGTTTMHSAAYKIATSTTATGPSWSLSPSVAAGEGTVAFAPPAGTDATVTVPAAASATASSTAPVVSGVTAITGGTAAAATASAPAPVVSVTSAGAVTAVVATATATSTAPAVGASSPGSINAVVATATAQSMAPTAVGTAVASTVVTAVVATASANAILPLVTATSAPAEPTSTHHRRGTTSG